MITAHSTPRRAGAVDPGVREVVAGVSAANLRRHVEALAFPRHYVHEPAANRRARDLLVAALRGFGYTPLLQGAYGNVVATAGGPGPHLLLGAHYDSVPGTPGADDNGSALAVCLECARLVKAHDLGAVAVVFFNREEDGLLGSREFVSLLRAQPDLIVDEAHVFEMVGYCTRAANSQRLPPGLPGVVAPKVGDFLGLLANRDSNGVAEELLRLAATYVPEARVVALKTYLGVERYFGHLHRSDHAPFWQAGIPAVMWTDTSEFRNPHYHQASDTPDTLDYDFMAQVARLAVARAAARRHDGVAK
jgi:Zn-dependent M28 family amino/carboxypeptidase